MAGYTDRIFAVTAKDFEGKQAQHEHYGKVVVTGRPKGARSMVNIRVVQRGPGWDDINQKYKKYFVGSYLQKDGSRSLRWGFTNTDQYGTEDTVHIESLTLIQ